MTFFVYILPMSRSRTIYLLVYEGFELLDMSGPVGVYTTAAQQQGESIYRTLAISARGGLINCSSGIGIDSQPIETVELTELDTVMAMGGLRAPLLDAMSCPQHIRFLRAAVDQCERIASVCSGAFLLAAAGLLNGRTATTHWQGCSELSMYFDNVRVEPDSMYVQDGRLWTSAGVTTGIDMALAMVEQDQGKPLRDRVARQLIVYSHRPGHQSQFSDLLESQIASSGEYDKLIDWICHNLHRQISVAEMAERMCMSERTFHRKFSAHMQLTPARLVENLRLERARDLLNSGISVSRVATRIGFRSESSFRTAYRNHFGVSPSWQAALANRSGDFVRSA